MLKLILPLILVITLNTYSNSMLVLKAGGSFNGSFNKDYWEEDNKTSLNLQGAIELQKIMNPYLNIGFGAAYHQGAELEKLGKNISINSEEKLILFNSIPVYLTGQLYFFNSNFLRIYAKLNYGYSYNFEDELAKKRNIKIEDGNYYALGLGLELKNLVLELVYEVNEAQVIEKWQDKKTDFTRISAYIGIKI